MDFLKIANETVIEFKEIAKKIAQELFDNYAIQTHDSIFRLTEIEFYWHSDNHADKSTYERKYVNPKAGEWFFHYSGVDIALRNEETGGYGGILIRGIYDINSKKSYYGPLVSVMKLFSGSNAFNSTIQTKFIPHNFVKSDVIKGLRIGLGKNAKESGADQYQYRFYIDPIK